MGNDPSLWKMRNIPLASLIFICLNLFIFLYVAIFPQFSPYYILCVLLPVYWISLFSGGWSMASFYLIIFLLTITFISGIALAYLKLYRYGAILFLICGILTLPLGLLGIMASILLWRHSTVLTCAVCNSSLKVDNLRPGYFYCSRCSAYYGLIGVKRNP